VAGRLHHHRVRGVVDVLERLLGVVKHLARSRVSQTRSARAAHGAQRIYITCT
jgi:hypothetical protein